MSNTTSGTHPDDSALTTDDRIIHATLTLISEHGLGAVTMSRVADVADVARQTLYNHYGDIDSIVAAAIDRHNRESMDLLTAALQVAETPTEKIEQVVRHFVMVGAHTHDTMDFGSGLSPDVRASLDSYDEAVEGHIRSILEDGQESGEFRADLQREIDTVLTRSLLNGISELAGDAPDRAAQIATAGTRTILAALR
ncbi:MAG: TetR/AcrR family transcriptional regulator [Actinomycetia bacterium]|nr:TetR/AcrR family transcriptional regulator [Actinomycetes bacterium]